ncbi:MAG: gas vesicle protein GvpN [Pseudanabaenaceae cyanobacterium bins.68]|nr:gas vesicle protein GvpN [Pseudanabaenaceae cyanobacterium bins.68]
MSTVLQASSRQFISTEFTKQIVRRAYRYLQSGYAVHLRGAAGTGKTTIAMHLASLLGRPMVLLYGDEDLQSSQLVGSQAGYSRKKVVDNFIHSVLKVEDDLRQSWVDSRLTMAAREGFTLVYDEFNRSRPETNNALLGVLEEKLIALPPDSSQSDYVRVHPNFRAIFTSNPQEYAAVHPTQDALMDRVITIEVGEADLETEHLILTNRVGIAPAQATAIIQLVRSFRKYISQHQSSSLRACLMIAKICCEHEIATSGTSADFRSLCADVLLSRFTQDQPDGAKVLHQLLDRMP